MKNNNKKVKRWKANPSTKNIKRNANPRQTRVRTADDEYEQYKAVSAGRARQAQNSKVTSSQLRKERAKQGGNVVRDEEKRYVGKKQHKKRKRKNVLGMVLVLMVVLAIGLSASVFIFFKIGEIQVTGSTKYTPAEIIESSGIELGDNLFASGTSTASKKIELSKPYINSVTYKHKLPSTLVICVKENKATKAFEKNGKYVLTNSELKVLEISETLPNGTALIKGTDISYSGVGTVARYSSSQKGEYIKNITKALNSCGINDITEIDVSKDISLSAVYAGRIRIVYGQDNAIYYKSELAAKAIEDLEKDNKNAKGTLNMKQSEESKQAYYNPEFK